MKKTLLCIAIGILSFYIGVSFQNLFYWEKIKINVPPIEEEFCSFQFVPYEPDNNIHQETEYSPSPDGAYFPDNEVESDTALILGVFDDSKRADIKIGNKIFSSENPVIVENRVSFKTVKSRQGIEYIFEGKFIQNPFKNWIEDGEINLRGTLTKRKNGKILYKIKTKYTFDSEVCAWNEIEFEQAN